MVSRRLSLFDRTILPVTQYIKIQGINDRSIVLQELEKYY